MPSITVGRTTTPAEGILGILGGVGEGLAKIQQDREAKNLQALQLLAKNPNVQLSPLGAGEVTPTSFLTRLLTGQSYEPGPSGAPVINVGGVPVSIKSNTAAQDLLRGIFGAGLPGGAASIVPSGIGAVTPADAPIVESGRFTSETPQASALQTVTPNTSPNATLASPQEGTASRTSRARPIPQPGTPEFAQFRVGEEQYIRQDPNFQTAALTVQTLGTRGDTSSPQFIQAIGKLQDARNEASKAYRELHQKGYEEQQKETVRIDEMREKLRQLAANIPNSAERAQVSVALNRASSVTDLASIATGIPGAQLLQEQFAREQQERGFSHADTQQQARFDNERQMVEVRTQADLAKERDLEQQRPIPEHVRSNLINPVTGEQPHPLAKPADVSNATYIPMPAHVQDKYRGLLGLMKNIEQMRVLAQGGIDETGSLTGKPGTYFDGVLKSDPGFFQQAFDKSGNLKSGLEGTARYDYAKQYEALRKGTLSTLSRVSGDDVGNLSAPEQQNVLNLTPASGYGNVPASARQAHIAFESLESLLQNKLDALTGGKGPRRYQPTSFEDRQAQTAGYAAQARAGAIPTGPLGAAGPASTPQVSQKPQRPPAVQPGQPGRSPQGQVTAVDEQLIQRYKTDLAAGDAATLDARYRQAYQAATPAQQLALNFAYTELRKQAPPGIDARSGSQQVALPSKQAAPNQAAPPSRDDDIRQLLLEGHPLRSLKERGVINEDEYQRFGAN